MWPRNRKGFFLLKEGLRSALCLWHFPAATITSRVARLRYSAALHCYSYIVVDQRESLHVCCSSNSKENSRTAVDFYGCWTDIQLTCIVETWPVTSVHSPSYEQHREAAMGRVGW